MSDSPGAALRDLRERKPLIHQITNYVVMNETANATLAIGALPVMAHAVEEVEEMAVGRRRARAQHRHALAALDRRDAARGQGGERGAACRSSSTRSASARRRCAPKRPSGSSTRCTSPICEATRPRSQPSQDSVPRSAVSRRSALTRAARRSRARRRRSRRRAVGHRPGGPCVRRDSIASVANGDALLATITGSGCMSSAITGCFAAVRPPLDGAAVALAAFGVAAEDAARGAGGPGTFHARLYDALYALTPDELDERANIHDA